jgi:hypothetical protein
MTALAAVPRPLDTRRSKTDTVFSASTRKFQDGKMVE